LDSGRRRPDRLRTLFSEKTQKRQLPMNVLIACAACFGQSDSPLAKGMNWGIMSLLVVVVMVLGSIALCSFVLARRAAAAQAPKAPLASAGETLSGQHK